MRRKRRWHSRVFGLNRWVKTDGFTEKRQMRGGKQAWRQGMESSVWGSVGYWTSKSRRSVDGCINESWSSREKLGLQTQMGRHQLIVCIESGCRNYHCILLENRTEVKKKEWYLLWAVNSLSLVFPY